jgi:hypothetical protein
MPNTTYGTPYAQSSDLVSNWPGVSLNVADRLDDVSFKGNGLNDQIGTTYTLVLTDAGKTVTLNNASAVTVTVPTNASVAYETGTCINLVNKGAGVVTIAAAGGVTINNNQTLAQYNTAILQKLDTNTWVVIIAPAPGLQFITSVSCGTSASVSINNCFSATYDVYRIQLINPIAATGAYQNLRLRLRLSGTDATTNYNRQYLDANSTTLTGARSTAQTSTEFMGISADGCSAGYMDIFNPALAQVTQFIALSLGGSATNTLGVNLYVANHTTATAYDGITLFPQTNSFNGGTIKIYGYRSS